MNFFFLLSTSLEELGPEEDSVVVAFKQLAEEYENKFRKQFNADIWNVPRNGWLNVPKKNRLVDERNDLPIASRFEVLIFDDNHRRLMRKTRIIKGELTTNLRQ